MSLKISELPAVTTLDNSDVLMANHAGVTSKILFSSLKTLLAYQPLNTNLTTYAGITPTAVGQNWLAAVLPDATSYSNISHGGLITYLTALQVVADLVLNGTAVDIATVQSLINKKINGLDVRVGTSPDSVGSVTEIPSPTDSYLLRLVKVGFTGGAINFRFAASTDVMFPKSGVLATIGKTAPTSDATQVSASTLNLDSTDGGQVDVTGTTGITAVTLAENTTKLVRFTGILTITGSGTLVLPGEVASITTDAGSFATFKGGSGGVVTVSDFHKGTGAAVANLDGGTVHRLAEFGISAGGLADGFEMMIQRKSASAYSNDRTLQIGLLDGDRTLTIGGNVSLAGAFATSGAIGFSGAFGLDVTLTAATAITLPAGTTTLAGLVGVPASAAAAGAAGTFSYDASFFYVCTAANTWKRVAIATW